MRKIFIVFSIGFLYISSIYSQTDPQVKAAWNLMNEGKTLEAAEALEKLGDKDEALISLILMGILDRSGKSKSVYYQKYLENGNVSNAILYAILNEPSVKGEDIEMADYQVKNLMSTLEQDDLDPALRASLSYDLSAYYLIKNKTKQRKELENSIVGIKNWSVITPFEDVMNSGYDKDHGTLQKAKESDVFVNSEGMKLQWYEPAYKENTPWIIKQSYYPDNSKLMYLQSFVEIEESGDYQLGLGYSGNVKLWVDDQLVHDLSQSRITDFDQYKYSMHLTKGFHRILVSFGSYTAIFPSVAVRILDDKSNPLDVRNEATYRSYQTDDIQVQPIEHYAKSYFDDMLKNDPDNLLTRLLAGQTFMNSYDFENAEIHFKYAEKLAPDNPLLILNLLSLNSDANNESEQSKYLSKYKNTYPQNVNTLVEDFKEHIDDKEQEKAKEVFEKIKSIEPFPEQDMVYQGTLYSINEEFKQLKSLAEKGHRKYPDNYYFTNLAYIIKKEVEGNQAGAIEVLNRYLENNYNSYFQGIVMEYYFDINKINKAKAIVDYESDFSYYDRSANNRLYQYYFSNQKYEECFKMLDENILSRKYEASNYLDYADVYFNMGNNKKATEYYTKALQYQPSNYTLKDKIFNLANKKEIKDLLDLYEVKESIKAFKKDMKTDKSYDYDIVFHERAYVLLDGGASASIEHYAVSLNSQSSLENFQRTSFGYNRGAETLDIDEAKVFKTDGTELDAERHGLDVVFTNLEIGDIIYVNSRIQSSYAGRTGKYFSDRFSFNGYNPIFKTRFNLLVEDGVEFKQQMINGETKYRTDKIGEFTHYVWEMDGDVPILKPEGNSPTYNDLATTIHISSTYEWEDIAEWYADLSKNQAKMGYNLEVLLEELFPDGYEQISETERARRIYDFIVKDIQYSSISFRQSGYIPQKASDVYSTRIGDCKDVSTLYATLTREVGLDSELILISTSNNGRNNLLLPSLDFNHCIASVTADDKDYYIELTNPYQSFGTLGESHYDAPILSIPFNQDADQAKFTSLKTENRSYDLIKRSKIVEVGLKDLEIKVHTKKTGLPASYDRSSYRDLPPDQLKENLASGIGSNYENGIKLHDYKFSYLDELRDSVVLDYQYRGNKEVLKIGSLYTFKVPFADVLFSANSFLNDERIYDFDLNTYEYADEYDESINIKLEKDYVFTELPEEINIEEMGTKYRLKITKVNDSEIIIHRIFETNRSLIPAESYANLKSLAEKIIEAENTHIVFKKK